MSNYYISVKYSTNRYSTLKLTSIAIVSEDNRELFLEGVSNARYRKEIYKFLDVDKTKRDAYSYCCATEWVAFLSLFNEREFFKTFIKYFRDLKFLEDYISEKVGSDFSVNEDSEYPFPDEDMTPLKWAHWMKRLHEFLIEFENRTITTKTEN